MPPHALIPHAKRVAPAAPAAPTPGLCLETPRLVLRAPETRDTPRIRKAMSNWQVARHLGRVPRPYPRDGAAQWIKSTKEAQSKGIPRHPFVIEEKANPAYGCIGVVSLNALARGSDLFIGYWLSPDRWGRGLMSEAAERIVAYGWDLGLREIEGTCNVENTGSARVLEKCGFVFERFDWMFSQPQKRHKRIRVYRIKRPERPAKHPSRPDLRIVQDSDGGPR